MFIRNLRFIRPAPTGRAFNIFVFGNHIELYGTTIAGRVAPANGQTIDNLAACWKEILMNAGYSLVRDDVCDLAQALRYRRRRRPSSQPA